MAFELPLTSPQLWTVTGQHVDLVRERFAAEMGQDAPIRYDHLLAQANPEEDLTEEAWALTESYVEAEAVLASAFFPVEKYKLISVNLGYLTLGKFTESSSRMAFTQLSVISPGWEDELEFHKKHSTDYLSPAIGEGGPSEQVTPKDKEILRVALNVVDTINQSFNFN